MNARFNGNRLQLVLAAAVPLTFLFVLSVVGAILVSKVGQRASLTQASTALTAQSLALARGVEMGDRGVADYQNGHTAQGLREYREGTAAIRSHARALLAMTRPSSPDRVEAQRYVSLASAGAGVLSRYLAYLQAGNAAAARRYAQSPAIQNLSKALATAELRFDDRERANATSLFAELGHGVRFYSSVVLSICVTGLLATLLTVGGLSRVGQRLRDAMKQKNELFEAYQRERHVASTLQRALLPFGLPNISGVRINAAYLPAARAAEVGGDWYDVFALSERTIAFGVGDVLGHDVYAATLMASARQAIRLAAREDPDPARVLQRLNRFLCSEETPLVTTFFGTLDLIDGTLSYATAGHPPPVVTSPDGSTAFLDGRGLVLGVDPLAVFTTRERRLGVGYGLLLYTDGLIEAERDYIDGVRKLEMVVRSTVSSGAGNIAEQIQKRIFSGIDPEDDSAILFLGVTELGWARLKAVRRAGLQREE